MLLGLASFYDLRDGEVPLFLVIAIPASGAIEIALSPATPEWLWRALSASGMMTAAVIAGAGGRVLRRNCDAGKIIGLGAADILLIGGGAFWFDPRSPALPGLFLLLSGFAGLLWAAVWNRVRAMGWPGPVKTFPMVPAISLVLFCLAACGAFYPKD